MSKPVEGEYWRQIEEVNNEKAKAEQEASHRKFANQKRQSNILLVKNAIKQLRVNQLTGVVLPILEDIEAHSPEIQAAESHDIIKRPSTQDFYHRTEKTNTPFTSEMSLYLRWGKLRLTEEENEMIEKYQSFTFPSWHSGFPDKIFSYDYLSLRATICPDGVTIGDNPGRSFSRARVLADPTITIPAFAQALDLPQRHYGVLNRKYSYNK